MHNPTSVHPRDLPLASLNFTGVRETSVNFRKRFNTISSNNLNPKPKPNPNPNPNPNPMLNLTLSLTLTLNLPVNFPCNRGTFCHLSSTLCTSAGTSVNFLCICRSFRQLSSTTVHSRDLPSTSINFTFTVKDMARLLPARSLHLSAQTLQGVI